MKITIYNSLNNCNVDNKYTIQYEENSIVSGEKEYYNEQCEIIKEPISEYDIMLIGRIFNLYTFKEKLWSAEENNKKSFTFSQIPSASKKYKEYKNIKLGKNVVADTKKISSKKTTIKEKWSLIISATSKEELQKLINKYFYSTGFIITEDNNLYNTIKEKNSYTRYR